MRELKGIAVPKAAGAKYEIVQYIGRWSDPSCDKYSFAVETVEPNVTKPEHFHRLSDEIYFVLSGSGWLNVNGREYPLTVGSTLLIEVGDRHFIRTSSEESLTVALFSSPAFQQSDYILC